MELPTFSEIEGTEDDEEDVGFEEKGTELKNDLFIGT